MSEFPPAPDGTWPEQDSPPDGFAQAELHLPKRGAKDAALRLIPLSRKGDRAGIEKQIQAGASVEEVDVEGNTPLHVATQAPKNETATVQCLIEHGARVNATNFLGASPLHYVCLREHNHRGIANILLENGADIDVQTLAGKTPLHFACEKQLPELVGVLCMFAAQVDVQDFEGNAPLHLALAKQQGRDTVKRQMLEHLLTANADAHGANHLGQIPLHIACQTGANRCVQYLLELQANAQAVTNRAETCAHLACRNNFAEVLQMVLVVVPDMVNAMDAEGNTPLHECASAGAFESAALLLKSGADANIKNHSRRTAADVAQLHGPGKAGDLNSVVSPELDDLLKEYQKNGTCGQS
mmetsp:Transcript_115154/g.223714  ORF Transcript_115154/g.223714 Transcript_115154/m.223714 type:complete len:355 (-) Transcript_115154:70-1134(-)